MNRRVSNAGACHDANDETRTTSSPRIAPLFQSSSCSLASFVCGIRQDSRCHPGCRHSLGAHVSVRYGSERVNNKSSALCVSCCCSSGSLPLVLSFVRRNDRRRMAVLATARRILRRILVDPILQTAVGIPGPPVKHFQIGHVTMQHRQYRQFEYRHEHAGDKVRQDENGQAWGGKRIQRQLHVFRHEVIGAVRR